MPDFVPGLRLSRMFYEQAVRPILERHAPGLRHSAALIGPGSEVLGFDTPLSMDHSWGPRVQLFLNADDLNCWRIHLEQALSADLPRCFGGYSTHFATTDDGGALWMAEPEDETLRHGVQFHTVAAWFCDYLGWDPGADPDFTDWLTFPEHRLRSVVDGCVFHDGLGELEPLRARLRYYPHEVWLYLMAAQWRQIAQEEAFLGRAGEVGDELGSRLIAARLVRYVMRLCFLVERTYAPYSKWFGTAFVQLRCGPRLQPMLIDVLEARDWREREAAMSGVYEFVVKLHNSLGITPALEGGVSPYFDRPYRVIHADRFADAINATMAPSCLARAPRVGSVSQFVDSTDILESPRLCRRLVGLYD